MIRHFLFLLLATLSLAFASAQVVYTSGAEGYKTFRIPAVIRLPDGTLLAFAEGRRNGAADFGRIDIVLKRSKDGGRTWSALQVVADNDTLQAGNPAPVMDLTDPAYPRGRLFLFYNTGNVPEKDIRAGKGLREVWYKTSIDGGYHWSPAVNITAQVHPADWRSYANTPGHAIQLKTVPYRGRLLVAANHSEGAPQPHYADGRSHDFYSDDHGKTFHLSASVPLPGSNEVTAAELPGGRVVMNMRNQKGDIRARLVAYSGNGGESWDSTAVDTTLPDPVCQGSLLWLGGTKLVFCNDASQRYRDSLTLRFSPDGGKRWKDARLVDCGAWQGGAGPQRDPVGYSDIVDMGHGNIGVLYEKENYTQIVFKRMAR